MSYQIRYFKLSEFRCPCCTIAKISVPLVMLLEEIREKIERPVIVTSGFRCKLHNIEVGGVENSRHMIGCASDLALPHKVPYRDFLNVCWRVIAPAGGKIKPYPERSFVHVAVPRHMSRWLWQGEPISLPVDLSKWAV